MRPTIIVPFHRDLDQLRRCLTALRAAAPSAEILVAADGAHDDPRTVSAEVAATVLMLDGPRGPAAARNRGADAATGDVLVFVDSDVVVHPDAIDRFDRLFREQPEVGAAFGAYDTAPADPGFVSQCKNLAHAFIHRRSSAEATTFWAGLGAVRTEAFRAAGGFDERFTRPSVEDIDLGYRLTELGVRIRLDPGIQGTHLKRWTWWSALESDVLDRGIPWTQLLHRHRALRNDLNLTWKYRGMVVQSYLAAVLLVSSIWQPWLLTAVGVLLASLWWADRDYYAFIAEQRGTLAATRWFPLHVLHHLANGVSFLAGTALRLATSVGLSLPGCLPSEPWGAGDKAAAAASTPAARRPPLSSTHV